MAPVPVTLSDLEVILAVCNPISCTQENIAHTGINYDSESVHDA